MKRLRLALAGCLALALLAAPAARAGGDPQYQGRVEKDKGTAFGFDVEKNAAGKRKVDHVSAALPFSCEEQAPGGTAFVFAPGGLTVKSDGSFAGKLNADFLTRGGNRGDIRLKGKLGKHGRASGTLSSEIFFAPRGGDERCYTGILEWSVKKGRHVTLPARSRGLGRGALR
jgi:hypothetical protein